jgi:hypothetical protein
MGRAFGPENLTQRPRSADEEIFGGLDRSRPRAAHDSMAMYGRITPGNYSRRVFGAKTERF